MDRTRTAWASLSDDQLLRECEVDTYRASGPGGQKRNKTSSAVRLRHAPSGLTVIAEESRSQHENRARALRRLRHALYLKIREPLRTDLQKQMDNAAGPEYAVLHGANGRLDWGRKDERFWPAVGLVLDALQSTSGRVAEAAALLGISTGNFVHFLQTEPKVWEEANHLRVHFGQKPLKSS